MFSSSDQRYFINYFNAFLNPSMRKSYIQTLNRYKQLAEEFVQTRLKGNRVKNLCDCCFVAGTLVWTQVGLLPIEKLNVGDYVYSLADNSRGIGQPQLKQVVNTITTPPKATYKITYQLKNGKYAALEASDNHPFYVIGKGWMDTLELKSGMKLIDEQKNQLKIKNISRVNGLTTTYNLTVLDNHTFFVGTNKIWVHNAGKNCSCENTSKAPATSTNPDDILSDIGKNKPVPLTSLEIKKVTEWSEVRLKYLSDAKSQNLSSITDTQVKNLIAKARNSIQKNMTPDDLAAVIKEQRGVKIPDPRNPGKNYDHISEFRQAANSIKNAMGNTDSNTGIIGAMKNISSQGKTNSYEYALLKNELKSLSNLLDYYEKKLR